MATTEGASVTAASSRHRPGHAGSVCGVPRSDLIYFTALLPWVPIAWYIVVTRGSPADGAVAAACYTVAAVAVPFRRRAVAVAAAVTFAAFAVMVATRSTTSLGVFPLVICVPLSIVAVVQWHPRRWPGILATVVAAVGSVWSPAVVPAEQKQWVYALHIAVLALCYSWASRRRLERENTRREREDAVRRAHDAERERIAEELHDGLGHALTAIRAKSATAAAGTADPQRMSEALQVIARLSADSLVDLRRTLGLLSRNDGGRPDGSSVPLQRFLADLQRWNADLTVIPDPATIDRIDSALAPPVRAVVRQVVEEAVINVIRHNGAGCPVTVQLDRIHRPGHAEMVSIDIANPVRQDAGPGDSRGSGRGLTMLRQRVADVGGVAAVDVGRERFTVKAIIPLAEAVRHG
ncbi:hypothetical protein AXK56_00310 [Tsukamurella pulmonis]|uniref:histidine kinase n=1 Tax=Tsukamurella pulmonis TaxID=47312 RepID=A0A1H1AKZ7_9ACTN|nr:histidine kinase [Tsukamurella pulmonis]KXO96030.1 hypothetical protein AXK56_00310 [Tsukamurella pulmonis]SDQ40368.1 Signal transduction histidine kinase [Tsukamurella pulmonis]SUP26472.1 Sensor histidine kinase desK [Tsukamurella pulmonis]